MYGTKISTEKIENLKVLKTNCFIKVCVHCYETYTLFDILIYS